MGFVEGQRVIVKAAIGAGPKGTVVSVEGDACLVVLDGKKKPRHYAASKLAPVRAEIQMIDREPVAIPPRQSTRRVVRASTYDALELRAQPKAEGPYRDRDYLAFVKCFPCCGCKSTLAVEPHHWADLEVQKRAAGQKVDDVYTVPLCRLCHDHVHGPGAGALPKMNRGMTTRVFLLTQVRLLAAYIKRAAA